MPSGTLARRASHFPIQCAVWVGAPGYAGLDKHVEGAGPMVETPVPKPPANWWKRWRLRRSCFHHDHRTGTSWVRLYGILDWGTKAYVCRACDKMFFV